jgi:hypothetical protein
MEPDQFFPFELLPNELLTMILTFLDWHSLCIASEVCTKWYEACNTDINWWRSKFEQLWEHNARQQKVTKIGEFVSKIGQIKEPPSGKDWKWLLKTQVV